MKAAFLFLALLTAGCVSRPSLVGLVVTSERELSLQIQNRWTPKAVAQFCSTEQELIQAPLVLADANWHGDIVSSQQPFVVRWEAIVIRNRVEVYAVRAIRGELVWLLECNGNPDLLSYEPGKIQRLIDESIRPNQPPQPTPVNRRG